MATTEGNRKIARNLKRKYGTDAKGRSKFHKAVGHLGGVAKESYFAKLQREDPEKLLEIAHRGARNSSVIPNSDKTKG